MSVLSVGPRGDPRFVKQHVVLERRGAFRDEDGIRGYRTSGFIVCDTCHSLVMSIADLAAVVGVATSSLSRFLKREPIREDVAAKIIASVKAVR